VFGQLVTAVWAVVGIPGAPGSRRVALAAGGRSRVVGPEALPRRRHFSHWSVAAFDQLGPAYRVPEAVAEPRVRGAKGCSLGPVRPG
jgi:hypothetical protein